MKTNYRRKRGTPGFRKPLGGFEVLFGLCDPLAYCLDRHGSSPPYFTNM